MARLLRELALPITEISVSLSILLLVGILKLAVFVANFLTQAALALGLLLALLAAVALLPVCARYLMEILDARLTGRQLPPLSLELLSRSGLVWSITPLVFLFCGYWLILETYAGCGYAAAAIVTGLLVTLLPALLAMLAISGSALASLDPRNGFQLIRLCRWHYLQVPTVIICLIVAVEALRAAGVPQFILMLSWAYAAAIAFAFTGAIVGDSGAREQVGIPESVEPDEATVTAGDDRIRRQVLNHAYGLFSRGNGPGGQACIEQYLSKSDSAGAIDERDWFFWQMLAWESPGPALFFARTYLPILIDSACFSKALKVFSRCVHEEPGFRPAPEDSDRLAEIARQAGNAELERLLRSD